MPGAPSAILDDDNDNSNKKGVGLSKRAVIGVWDQLFMRLFKGSLAGLALTGILAIAPTAASAHGGEGGGHGLGGGDGGHASIGGRSRM
jgi:hypothetical protein